MNFAILVIFLELLPSLSTQVSTWPDLAIPFSGVDRSLPLRKLHGNTDKRAADVLTRLFSAYSAAIGAVVTGFTTAQVGHQHA